MRAPVEKGARSWRPRARFSSTRMSSSSPRCCLSAGTCPTLASRKARGAAPASCRPSTSTLPASGRRRPVSTSTSSAWPLPSTPAIARISPASSSKPTSASAGRPRSFEALRPETFTSGAPAFSLGGTRIISATSRPTISAESCAALVWLASTVATSRPRRITPMRWATPSTSRSLWEMKTTVLPASARLRTTR